MAFDQQRQILCDEELLQDGAPQLYCKVVYKPHLLLIVLSIINHS